MARRAGRRGGIIKLYPPPLASQLLPANQQPHFMKGGRGGEGGRRQRGQREGGRRGEKGRRKEKGRDEEGKIVNVEAKWDDWKREGVEGGNKGEQVSEGMEAGRVEQDTRQLLSIHLRPPDATCLLKRQSRQRCTRS